MTSQQSTDERLRQVYHLLQELLERPADGGEAEETRWHAPPLPPLSAGGRLSATDLLSWWFRPPSGGERQWNQYFGDSQGSTSRPIPVPGDTAVKAGIAANTSDLDLSSRAAIRAVVEWPKDDLPSEDADAAVEILYDFLHAVGRHDIAAAMQCVADDYHAIEDDREVNRNDLRSRLESLLESLHGFEFEVSLSMVPEPLLHPYGIVIYAEIQIDAWRPEDDVKRNLLERWLVLLQRQADFTWKIAAFSRPKN